MNSETRIVWHSRYCTPFFQHVKGSGKRLSMSNSETLVVFYHVGSRHQAEVIKLGHKSALSILHVLYFCMCLFVLIYRAHLSPLPPEPSTAASSCPTYSLKASGGRTVILLLSELLGVATTLHSGCAYGALTALPRGLCAGQHQPHVLVAL